MVAPHDARLWVVIEGFVTNTQDASDTAHLDRLAERYLGRARRNPELPRRILTIQPIAVHWWAERQKIEEPVW
jgi:hypothetical protein